METETGRVETEGDRTSMSVEVIELALLLGVTGDILLRTGTWGLNVPLWLALVAACIAVLCARWRKITTLREQSWLLFSLLLYGCFFAWRSSYVLRTLDALVLFTLLSMLTLSSCNVRLRLASMSAYIVGYCVVLLNSTIGPFLLFLDDIRWAKLPRTGWSRQLVAVLRGLLLAIPLLLIFGLLFVAADAVFKGFVTRALDFRIDILVSHVALIAIFSWLLAGLMRGVLLGRQAPAFGSENVRLGARDARPEPVSAPPDVGSVTSEDISADPVSDARTKFGFEPDAATEQPGAANHQQQLWKFVSLGTVELVIVLGLVNLLFLSFVLVQIRYLFGGAALVLATNGLSYAEYARNGFFQLVAVVALILPILLLVDWLLRRDNPVQDRVFRLLVTTNVVLIVVIMASAFRRMMLYQSEYGLTELRLYTTAFMCWLGLILVWFVLTVLRGERKRFAHGAVLAGFAVVFCLHVMNPDAFIVTNNARLATNLHEFDAKYAITLSDDAVPALAQVLPALTHDERCRLAAELERRHAWISGEAADMRRWSWARAVALRTLKRQSGSSESFGCGRMDIAVQHAGH